MKRMYLVLTVLAMAVVATGCAITDYDGFANHNTQSESKLWGSEIAFLTGDSDTGTYSYTVKYDNRGGRGSVTINTYKNDVYSSFSRDGVIDRDGDDVQGSSGDAGGKFLPWFRAVDADFGCQFGDNLTFDKSANGPSIFYCLTTNEEVDKDLDLQASFASFGGLIDQIWSGAITGEFTAELNGLVINGVTVPVQTFSVAASSNGVRPMRLAVDLTQPGAASVIQTILDNTQHGVPVSLGMTFEGGMQLGLPGNAQVAFNHDALWNLL